MIMTEETHDEIQAIAEHVAEKMVEKAIEQILEKLPERLRPMVREEVDRCCALKVRVLPEFTPGWSEPPIVPLKTTRFPPAELREPRGPVNPKTSDSCHHCGEMWAACHCSDLHRHD